MDVERNEHAVGAGAANLAVVADRRSMREMIGGMLGTQETGNGKSGTWAFWRRVAPATRLGLMSRALTLFFAATLTPVVTSAQPATASFTDSQSRTLLFRYELAEGQDPDVPQGILVFFHGNNTGTQGQILDSWFPSVKRQSAPLDLVPVVVASPHTKRTQLRDWYSGNGIRHWYPEDQALVHELLQSHLGRRFRVDHDRVFLWGGSQGACFLNDFVPRYGAHYGGGLLAECGCFNERNPTWKPPPGFSDRFRVFIQDTTGDFLYPHGLDAYGYYRYTVGLDTRGDLAGDGGHCAAGEVSTGDALNWLVHGVGLPEEPEFPHMTRVSPMDFVTGMSVDGDGALWIVRQAPGVETTLWRSVDGGRSFVPVSRIHLRVGDLDAVGGALLVTHPRPISYSYPLHAHPLHRSDDQGRTFEPVALPGHPVLDASLIADRHERVFFPSDLGDRNEIHASDDRGGSWSPLGLVGLTHERLVNPDAIVTDGPIAYLFTGERDVRHVGTTTGNDWNVVSGPGGERIRSMVWDGDLFWGYGGGSRLYTSTDRGQSWVAAEWPQHARSGFGATINALGDGQVFVVDGGGDGHLGHHGAWTRIYGSGTFKRSLVDHHVAVDHTSGDVYFTHGRGVFRLGQESRSIDAPTAQPDTDGDGIADVLDQLPADGGEYLDTDGDGVGNGADADDDGDGVGDSEDDVPLDHRDAVDTDGDGLGDRVDVDDDGDGVLDGLDAFPLDRARTADSDGDGADDWADDDDDGDGVPDVSDVFPLHPGEWADTDGDGIGDNMDLDDDSDGRHDQYDPAPKVVRRPMPGLRLYPLSYGQSGRTALRPEPDYGVVYPQQRGPAPRYGEIRLVDDAVAFMIDDFGGYARIYVDRNNNRNLTDDGPPALAEGERRVARWIDARYPSGAVIPYAVSMYLWGLTADGAATGLSVSSQVSWRGEVSVLGGRTVPVGVFDYDVDGLYTGSRDYVCIDVDRGMSNLASCYNRPSALAHGDTFTLDGQEVQVLVAMSGHHVEIGPPGHSVPYVPAASHPDWQGFVRVTNRGASGGTVRIHAFDDAGTERGLVTLDVPAGATRHFNSVDLEQGNPAKGLASGVGPGDGDWHLQLRSDLDLDVLAYVRTTDGFLTSMHDVAVRDDAVSRIPTVNPGSNREQASLLRLVNPGNEIAEVSIRGIDDNGRAASADVLLTVPARGARTVNAWELEGGGEDLAGTFGDGSGKWRLEITSEKPLRAMSLLHSPGGHLTNLSTPSYEDGGPLHQVTLFPAASDPVRQGFARIVNRSSAGGVATIFAYDDAGVRHGPVALSLPPFATVHFNSDDLENGNPAKGLTGGVGNGMGAWWLEIDSDLDLDVLGYVRTIDGFLTAMHDSLHRSENGIHVPTVNPGSNLNQVSQLRLVNPGDDARRVTIVGIDDDGRSPGSPVSLSVPPRGARTYTSLELESGASADLSGALGDGAGKWRLEISSDGPLRVMSLLNSPTGHLTNLSTLPERFPSRKLAAINAKLDTVQRPSLADVEAPRALVTPSDPVVIQTNRFGTVHFDRSILVGGQRARTARDGARDPDQGSDASRK